MLEHSDEEARELVVLRYSADLSYKEIAELMEWYRKSGHQIKVV